MVADAYYHEVSERAYYRLYIVLLLRVPSNCDPEMALRCIYNYYLSLKYNYIYTMPSMPWIGNVSCSSFWSYLYNEGLNTLIGVSIIICETVY